MQFVKITVQNFGVYRGSHEFLLAPTALPGVAPRNITVVCGHNGAGKSTLFEAIGVALHGAASLGDRVTRQTYSDFLMASLHRFHHKGVKEVSSEGSVAVTFTYVQAGRPKRIGVERRWHRTGATVRESLTVVEDGRAPEIDPSDFQAWINDLVPPSLASICFFDADQLNAFSSPQNHEVMIQRTLRRVLGLDIIERLEADLDAYSLKTGGKLKASPFREQVLKFQEAVEALDEMIAEREEQAEVLSKRRGELHGQIVQTEREIVAEGGTYAARRPVVKERLTSIERESEDLKRQLEELAGELLPFAVAPALCKSLSARLDVEAAVARESSARELLGERLSEVEASLANDSLWQGLRIASGTRAELVGRIRELLQRAGAATDNAGELIHNLSDEERRKLQDWIVLVRESVPQTAAELGSRLKALEKERKSVVAELDRSPDEARLASIHAKLVALQQQMVELEAGEAPLLDELRTMKHRREEKARERQRAHDQLMVAQATEVELDLANRSRLALRAYRDALTAERIAELEIELVRAFNSLCRKARLLGSVHINAGDGRIELVGADGHPTSLLDFSNGERQLFGLALLEALRMVSGRQLPIAIDTPLARLDDNHRTQLLQEYFPRVSDQVLLFATDVELDQDLLVELRPAIARVYRLSFDHKEDMTKVECESYGEDLHKAAAAALDSSVLST